MLTAHCPSLSYFGFVNYTSGRDYSALARRLNCLEMARLGGKVNGEGSLLLCTKVKSVEVVENFLIQMDYS